MLKDRNAFTDLGIQHPVSSIGIQYPCSVCRSVT